MPKVYSLHHQVKQVIEIGTFEFVTNAQFY